MSHMVKASFKFNERNIDFLKKAVEESKNASWLGHGTYHFYSGQITGEAFKLEGWKYPCIITEDGLQYDNFGGRWGKQEILDKIVQEAVAKTVIDSATMSGFTEYGHEFNEDGQLVVTMCLY